MPRPINSRLFTSFYWFGNQTERTVIRACSVQSAWEEHNECGPNAYDDRRLVDGDVATPEEALTRRPLCSSSGEE